MSTILFWKKYLKFKNYCNSQIPQQLMYSQRMEVYLFFLSLSVCKADGFKADLSDWQCQYERTNYNLQLLSFDKLETQVRHLYVLIRIRPYPDEDVNTGIPIGPISRIQRWKINWVLPIIIFVLLPIQLIRVLFVTLPILVIDGNTAIVRFAIELKVEVNAWGGILII